MALKVTHKGVKLTQEQLDAVVPVLNWSMQQDGNIPKAEYDLRVEAALEKAGCPLVVKK